MGHEYSKAKWILAPWKRGGIVIIHIRGAQSAGGKARGLGGLPMRSPGGTDTYRTRALHLFKVCLVVPQLGKRRDVFSKHERCPPPSLVLPGGAGDRPPLHWNGVGKPVKDPPERRDVRDLLRPEYYSGSGLGQLWALQPGCTVDASRAWKREILHDGQQARTVFFFGSPFRTLVWAWHDRVYGVQCCKRLV